jgi:amino acid adenylation domain-containing protein
VTQSAALHPWQRCVVLGEYRARVLGEALCEVARHVPYRVAVEDDHDSLTYRELISAVQGVQAAVRAREPGSCAPVTVLVGHGVHAVIAVLGVMTAGRTAVPLDARDPLDRLTAIHTYADATLMVAHRANAGVARSVAGDRSVLVAENLDAAAATEPRVDPASTGIVLFTSGSTGTPKGVMIANDTIVDNALRMGYAHGLTADDGIAVPGSLAFGASYSRIFAGLVAGSRVCLYDLRERGPGALPQWANAHDVTWMLFVPSVLRAVLEHADRARMDSVRVITFGGEALYGRDVRLARSLFSSNTVFRNRLSSTETHGIAGRTVTPEDERSDVVVPVGAVEPWVEVQVVDDDGEAVAPGSPGRLVVIGDKLATGYWKDPELTAERFFDLPDGRRAFFTSDIVQSRDDGTLEHLGRNDDRVKVRGAMVSLTEVERALARVNGVAAGVVKAFPGDAAGIRLVAYIAPADGHAPSPASVRRALAESVPAPMVPGTVVMVDALPIGDRGKVDRAALEEPPIVERAFRAPIGREQDLAEIFCDVLGVESVGLDDDFFELGGDSLAAVELMVAVDEQFGVQLSASTLLDTSTVAQLALRLARRRPYGACPVIRLNPGGDMVSSPPFFCLAGGGSPAVTLRVLAEHLDRAVYGIQARGLEEWALPDRTVEACARRYLAEIRRIQPAGPYVLGGYSFGGMIAFEMACRLETAGETVALLVIVDTAAPGTKPSASERLVARVDNIRHSAKGGGIERAVETSARVLKWSTSSAVAHAARALVIASAGLVPRRDLDQYHVFYRLSAKQRRHYRPRHTFGGSALLVRAQDGGLDRTLGDDLGWSKYLRGAFEISRVPGDHSTIIKRPRVSALADELQRALAIVA